MKPVLLTVDDDPLVLVAIERDFKQQYSNRFLLLQADSGFKGLELIKQLKLRSESVALFLVDQRMPQMTGVEFLEHALNTYPEAKSMLLTDYGDTDSIIKSINKVRIDYYLTKPWDPAEVHLYPVLNEILDDWWASCHPPFEGIKVIGLRWSPRSHEIKDFLARNGIPYQWLDIEGDEEACRLVSIINSTWSDISTTNNNNADTSSFSSDASSISSSSSFLLLYIYRWLFFLMVHTYLNQPT
jgi:thioredoxin reductase (NADPH)